MNIKHPTRENIPDLRALWQFAFADTDDYLDRFFATAFREDHSLCCYRDNMLAAACYWLDCGFQDQKLAYLYAVVTAPEFRGQGLCRALLETVKETLGRQGYAGVLLVPGDETLRAMYARMGWRDATGLGEFSCAAGTPLPAQRLTTEEYAALRPLLLPQGAAIEGPEIMAFLATQVAFYRCGQAVAACLVENEHLFCPEFLGSASLAPHLAAALGCVHATVRTPGEGKAWAMYCPLSQADAPSHFSFALD